MRSISIELMAIRASIRDRVPDSPTETADTTPRRPPRPAPGWTWSVEVATWSLPHHAARWSVRRATVGAVVARARGGLVEPWSRTSGQRSMFNRIDSIFQLLELDRAHLESMWPRLAS